MKQILKEWDWAGNGDLAMLRPLHNLCHSSTVITKESGHELRSGYLATICAQDCWIWIQVWLVVWQEPSWQPGPSISFHFSDFNERNLGINPPKCSWSYNTSCLTVKATWVLLSFRVARLITCRLQMEVVKCFAFTHKQLYTNTPILESVCVC